MKKWFALILEIILLVFSLLGCGTSKDTPVETTISLPELSWPQNELASLVPVPASQYGEVQTSTKDQVSILVMQTGQEDYYSYVNSCENSGFNNVEIETDAEFKATNAAGYRLEICECGNAEMLITIRQPLRKINISVDCGFNLLFNKYDVSMYWNGIEAGVIPHGEEVQYHFDVENGTYTVAFTKVGSTSPQGTVTIDVYEDADVTFDISCGGDEITIEQTYISMRPLADNEVRMPTAYNDFLYEHYDNAISKLTELGFENIKTVAQYDIYWGITDEGDVGEISINGNKNFDVGAIFEKESEVVITYHMLEENDPSRIIMQKDSSEYERLNYEYVEQELKALGFTNIVFVDKLITNTGYHTGEVAKVEINYGGFVAGESFMPTEKVEITRYKVDPVEAEPPITVTISSESLVGTHFSEAELILREMGFKNVTLCENITYDSEVIPETISCIEIDVDYSFMPGEMFAADAEVILSYWKYEKFTSDYDLAFIRRAQDYSLYYLFDIDAKKVAYFSTADTGVDYGTFKGEFSTGIIINWKHGQWTELFTYGGNGSKAIVVDGNGFEWEYVETDLFNAHKRMNEVSNAIS